MTKTKYVEVIAPFNGFYNTIHGGNIESVAEIFLEGDEDNPEKDDNLDYRKMRISYSTNWVDKLSSLINDNIDNNFIKDIDIKFKDLESPKYYNYTNDSLIMNIDIISIQKIQDLIIKKYSKELEIELKERFTGYDGFTSFYPNTTKEFLLTEQDHNTRAVNFKIFLKSVLDINDETLKNLVEYDDIELIFNE